MPEDLAVQFHTRFAGLERAHGHSKLKNVTSDKGKQEAAHSTLREPPSVVLWEKHLAGTYSIGIVPIRDDSTVRFGAIDIDQYEGFDLVKLSNQIIDLDLPLTVCRTKSGGAHLYLFCDEDINATLVRGKLMEWAVVLGYSGVEVYPKQTRLAGPNDVGNWINMPYFGGETTNRYAVDGDLIIHDPQAFLDLATRSAVSTAQLTAIATDDAAELGDMFTEAPPCLQCLATRGFGEGSRNNGLFDVGVYLRKRYGDDDFAPRLDEYNQKYFDPPLGHKEVASVIKSLSRKAYEYRCNDQPIVAVCNRQICLTRKYGIGTSDNDPGVVLGNLIKLNTDPVSWIIDVDGARIELLTQELKDQQRFHTRVMEELNKWPFMIKPKAWSEMIRNKLLTVEVLEVPADAKPEGAMWTFLEAYCTGRQRARSKEELLLNKPWTNKADGRVYFNGPDFKAYLEKQRMRVTEKQLWGWLRSRGAQHGFFNINGKGFNWWSVNKFTEQDEDFKVPKLSEDI